MVNIGDVFILKYGEKDKKNRCVYHRKLMLEISLMNDIRHLMLGTCIFNSNATLKHLNVYLENKFGVNLNSDKKQALRIIKLTNLNL